MKFFKGKSRHHVKFLSLIAAISLSACSEVLDQTDEDQNKGIDILNARMEALENNVQMNALLTSAISEQLSSLQSDLDDSDTSLTAMDNQLANMQSQIDMVSQMIVSLEAKDAEQAKVLASVQNILSQTQVALSSMADQVESNQTMLSQHSVDIKTLTANQPNLEEVKKVLAAKADQSDLHKIENSVARLNQRTRAMRMTEIDGKPSLLIENVNLHVRNGSDESADINGLGNIIVGYDESEDGSDKSGSHNVVLGPNNGYDSYGQVYTVNAELRTPAQFQSNEEFDNADSH